MSGFSFYGPRFTFLTHVFLLYTLLRRKKYLNSSATEETTLDSNVDFNY